ncbi:putative carbonic anhydrase 5, partial [Anneissia japonica]|uniref:putative carbonic anhydrase 5 n=1 Tax=Anneissia japonica TaxID=1529436 RepID=UPI00142568E4
FIVKLSFDGGNYAISGGGLTDAYNAAQLHFHWGSVSSQGSEHTIDGMEYPAELHIVHVKDGLTLAEALTDPSGLAVLGFLIEVSDEDNDDFAPLIDAIVDLDDDVVLNTSIVLGDIIPNDVSAFYRYDGSLTTPTCDEAVIWTVFKSTISLSESQLDVFRDLTDGDGNSISNNYRPPQPVNTRTIYRSENGGNVLTVSLIALVLVGILHVSL